jgi:hypothetical protein
MRILPSLFLPYLLSVFSFALLLTGCQQPSLQKALFGSCKSTQQEQAQKNIEDLHQRFEISIPSNWKKEFFIDSSSTRFYCADTTKELTDTYIIEIGHYTKNILLDTLFVKTIEGEVLQKEKGEVLQSKLVRLGKKKGYSIHSKYRRLGFDFQTVQSYFPNANGSLYLLKVEAYGTENSEARLCEGMALLDKALLHER